MGSHPRGGPELTEAPLGLSSVTASFADRILSLPAWLALLLVFALPALEASAFVGFVFPGELAVILGGAAASRGTVQLWAVAMAAVSGAIIGDSLGYLVGRRWGSQLLRGTVGRLPLVRPHLDRHLLAAQAYVRRRKGAAVFFGRFTTALRVLVPGLAGMSDVHYPTFLAYNVAGGVLWGAGFAVLGFAAGRSYHHVEHLAGRIGVLLLALIVLGLAVARVTRGLQQRSHDLRALRGRIANTRAARWVRRRFPRELAWIGRRLDPSSPRGFALTFTLAVGALSAWVFAGLTQDVLGHDEMARVDPRVMTWVLAHRAGWLTALMRTTWLGSIAVLVPLAVGIGGLFLLRRRGLRPGVMLAVALAGAVTLSDVVKPAVDRQRPPASFWIGHYSGAAFPSGHATQAVVFYGMVALLLSRGQGAPRRAMAWAFGALIVLLVGATRIYLGAHWLSDVLAGYALGATWLALMVAVTLVAGPKLMGERLQSHR